MSKLGLLVGKMLLRVTKGTGGEYPRRCDGVKGEAYGGVHGQNEEWIAFHCEDGDYVYLADGDCCSRTYIESVEGPTSGRIMSVDEPSWEPEREEDHDGEVHQFYKATFAIEGQGHLDVTYRNESNGYYGGSLELLSAPAPGQQASDDHDETAKVK